MRGHEIDLGRQFARRGLAVAALGSAMACLSACEPRKDPAFIDASEIDRNHGNMMKAIENGTRTLSWARDFDRTFPGSEHHISYYMGGAGPRTWRSAVGIDGRYILRMDLPIDLDASGTQVSSQETPIFELSEVREILPLPDGGKEITKDPDGFVTFGPPEWAKLVAAHGDLSAIGVTVKAGPPLPGFEKPWNDL